jgi:hypothetical protein
MKDNRIDRIGQNGGTGEHYMFEDYLPTDQLEVGKFYLCKARNFEVGQWNGATFTYIRYKFGNELIDQEYHWDNEVPAGTAKPLTKLPTIQDYITTWREEDVQ